MGQILSQPVTEKFGENGENKHYVFGISSMQGWRLTMEDAHTAQLDMGPEGVAYFGVYDGHGGDKTALFAGENTWQLVKEAPSFGKDYSQALRDGFLGTDQAVLDASGGAVDASGCAATGVIVTNEYIICANTGDSRTVLGSLGQAKALSYDHKPDNEGEKSRIINAGGYVDMGRVNGNLALSRAFGDFTFKRSPQLPPEQQVVTACPDIIEHKLGPNDEFLVLACDGIWDCMNSQEVVEFIRRGISEKLDLTEICELLMDECLAPESDTSGIGCDNMTVCIVALLQGRTKEEWYAEVGRRVEAGEGPVMARSTAAVRAAIESRAAAQPAQPVAGEPAQNPHAMLQQLFSGAPNGGQLNPEATNLLSRLGIRFLSADGEDEDDHDFHEDAPEDVSSEISEPEHESDTERD